MHTLKIIAKQSDIPSKWQNTPFADLLLYHNLKREYKEHNNAELLIGMCMDNRKMLHIPEKFAFILRTGGANVRYSEFKVSYAIAVGGIEYIALIGHTNCGMVNLMSKKQKFIEGLCEKAGWEKQKAEEHFMNYSPMFEINNEVDFIVSETQRLSLCYPKIKIAPLLYKVEDNLLYWINE